MVYGYIRVSTDRQTVENQRFEINNYCKSHKLKIHEYIFETISGTREYTKRKLGKLLSKLQKDDVLIASELSRLGRSLFMIMTILNICMTKGVKVITIKDGFELQDDIESKVLAFAFGLSAEIERQLISQRTKEALNRLKSEGIKLGRPVGAKSHVHKLDGEMENIQRYLEKGRTKVWIARKYKVHVNTLYNRLNEYSQSNLLVNWSLFWHNIISGMSDVDVYRR